MEKNHQCYHNLKQLIEEVTRNLGSEFFGLGVIVSSDISSLPLFQLPVAKSQKDTFFENTAKALRSLSYSQNALHDGFHILTPSLEMVKSNCYVAAPIPPASNIMINPKWKIEELGSRWFTAYFSSMLPQVCASVAVGTTGRVNYFIKGRGYIDSLKKN